MRKVWLGTLLLPLLILGWRHVSVTPSLQETPAARPTPPAVLDQRYGAFREAEARLTIPEGTDLASLEQLFEQREQLRRQRFSPAEQEQLFADERRQEQWTLRRKALQQASPEEQAVLQESLDVWLSEQPEWFQRSVENGRVLERLRQHQEDRQWQLEQLGPEAADRLAELKQNQQAFDKQLQGYLKERAALSDDQQIAQQQSLLEHWFPESQWRRVEALTRITQE